MAAEEKVKAPSIERPPEAEKVPEALREAPAREVVERVEKPVETPLKAPPPPPAAPPSAPAAKDQVLVQVESILAEDLQEVYAALPEEVKPRFKAKGEEVARTIRTMFTQAKVKTRKVLKLIAEWLKMIPGVNRFFLEQEAAIKTEKIVALAEEKKKSPVPQL